MVDLSKYLTPREWEIVQAIGYPGADYGLKSNQELAEEFYVSSGTIKAHMKSILPKLGLHSRVQIYLALHGHNPRFNNQK